MKHFLTTAVVVLVLSTPAKAQWNSISTIQDYYTTCVMEPPTVTFSDGMQAGICLGFLRGISQFAQLNCDVTNTDIPYFMKADLGGVTFLAQQQAMRNWAQMNPQYWSDNSATLVLALSEAWPCTN